MDCFIDVKIMTGVQCFFVGFCTRISPALFIFADKRLCQYAYFCSPIVRQPIGLTPNSPTPHWSDTSLVRDPNGLTTHWANTSMVWHLTGLTLLWYDTLMVPNQWSDNPFPDWPYIAHRSHIIYENGCLSRGNAWCQLPSTVQYAHQLAWKTNFYQLNWRTNFFSKYF